MGNSFRQINYISVGSSHIDIIIAMKKEFGLIDIINLHTIPTNGSVINGSIVNFDLAKRELRKAITEVREKIRKSHPMLNLNILSFYVGLPSATAKTDYGFVSEDMTTLMSQREKLVSHTDIVNLYKRCGKKIQRVVTNNASAEFIPRTTYCDSRRFYPNPNKQMCRRLSCDYIYTYLDAGIEETWRQLLNELGCILEELVFDNVLGFIPMFNDNEKDLGSILVDIGSETTSLTVFKKYLVGIHSLNVGSSSITSDICRNFHCTPEVADEIKHRFYDIYSKYVQDPKGYLGYSKMDGQKSWMPLEMIMDLFNNKLSEITHEINLFVNHVININRLFEIKYSVMLDDRLSKSIKKKADAIINTKIKVYKDTTEKAISNDVIDQLMYELSFIDRNITFNLEDQVYNGALMVVGGGAELHYVPQPENPLEIDKKYVFEQLILHSLNNQDRFNLFLKTKISYQNELSSENMLYFIKSTAVALGMLSYMYSLDYEDVEPEDSDTISANINIMSKRDLNIRFF